jgi:hypothetical protein
MRFIGYE